jgi:Xaa-Pro aminopeptidase
MEVSHKLRLLRNCMETHKVSGFLQPVHDEYMNEYPPACARRVEWLSGFTGSAGTVAVLKDRAALFTDGRYTLQAGAQADAGLFELYNSADKMPEAWLAEHLPAGAALGYDARLHTPLALRRLENALGKKNAKAVGVPNLVDLIWNDRPSAPASPLFIHDQKYSGEASSAKRQRIGAALADAGADAAVVTAPDSICWLLNIRARDVENSPLALATAIIDRQGAAQLFIAPSRCDEKVRAQLGNEVAICEPATLEESLQGLGRQKKRVLADPQSVSAWIADRLSGAGATLVERPDPCLLPKAMKNPVELQGMRSAHIRDGLAVTRLLYWLDAETGKRAVTELEVAEKLLSLRAESDLFCEPSFNTIAGSGPHGAIVHYRATETSNRALEAGELFLLDSGGQYPDGTTDITRTVPIGKPSEEQRDRFTRVLKGHIAIATARFPEGTCGSQLDALARQFLWEAGLDYDHGTGHGVGCFLNVHEGPQRIAKRGGDAPLKPGMIVSNEPGYYKAGEYGIRIENLVTVTQEKAGESKPFYGFETLTCAPIDTRLIDTAMLSAGEKSWLNAYHAWVLEQLSLALDKEERTWLAARCAAI